jgi:hypothetical protein
VSEPTPDPCPYFHGTEEWDAFFSGLRDTQVRIAKGHVLGPVNEDHLVMIGQAYVAGIRAARTKQTT